MRKENLLLMFSIIVIALVAVFFLACFMTGRNRDSSVEILRKKAAAAEKIVLSQYAARNSTSEPKQTHPIKEAKVDTTDKNTIVVFEQLNEKRKILETDPEYQEDYELVIYQHKWTEENWCRIESFLDQHHDLILEIRQLAETGGPFFETDFSEGNAMIVPPWGNTSGFARLLAADAVLALKRGNYDEAIQNYQSIVNLANSFREIPLLTSQLFRVAVNSIFWSNVAEHIHVNNVPPEFVMQLIEIAANTVDRSSFADAFIMEGLMTTESFNEIRAGNLDRSGMVVYESETFLLQFYESIFARPFLNMDEEVYISVLDRMSDIMTLPFYEAKPQMDRINTEVENLSFTRLLSRWRLPMFIRLSETQARDEAQLGLLQVGLAVELYHEQNDVYPETLDEVNSILDGNMPLDPYTGKPFVYMPEDNSFTLYSARGSVFPPEERTRNFYDDQGNIVWRGSER